MNVDDASEFHVITADHSASVGHRVFAADARLVTKAINECGENEGIAHE